MSYASPSHAQYGDLFEIADLDMTQEDADTYKFLAEYFNLITPPEISHIDSIHDAVDDVIDLAYFVRSIAREDDDIQIIGFQRPGIVFKSREDCATALDYLYSRNLDKFELVESSFDYSKDEGFTYDIGTYQWYAPAMKDPLVITIAYHGTE